jgi:hypothetical protein
MSSQPELQSAANETRGTERWQQERLEDYLDHVCAPLVGIVPYPARQSFRMEVEDHLGELIGEFQDEGLDLGAATQAALREHGEPWLIGQEFLDEWCRSAPQGRLARYASIATLRAFALLGIAAVPALLLIERYTLFLNDAERSQLLPLLLLYVVLAPIAAGSLTGATTPAGTTRAVGNALAVLILASMGVGLAMLPYTEGLYLALFQLLFWVPAGYLSTSLAASLGRSYRRQRFLRWRRQSAR